MAKLRIEDLKKIKEASQGVANLRDGEFRMKIIVHMGTCGIAAGARPVMTAFLQKLETSGVNDVMLTSSGCAGLCNHEPMVTVETGDAAPVKYILLDPQKAERIFEEHVIGGKPVAEYALSMGSETTY